GAARRPPGPRREASLPILSFRSKPRETFSSGHHSSAPTTGGSSASRASPRSVLATSVASLQTARDLFLRSSLLCSYDRRLCGPPAFSRTVLPHSPRSRQTARALLLRQYPSVLAARCLFWHHNHLHYERASAYPAR